LNLQTIERDGKYFRVAAPDWEDPLDASFAQSHGGRWNPPGSWPTVYLNATIGVARANVLRKFVGHPINIEDVAESEGPDLVETEVPHDAYVDIVTDSGCHVANLPRTYPRNPDGTEIAHEVCWPVGEAAVEGNHPGIACRSAAPEAPQQGEELAWFGDSGQPPLAVIEREPFDYWFWQR
jgi:hypothetical protein